MRILFSFVGGNGHFQPLVPLARAAVAAGHPVGVCCARQMTSAVEAAGFTALPVGNRTDTDDPPPRSPLIPLDPEKEDRDLRDGFALRGSRTRTPLLRDVCREWTPDIVVCDEVDFGAMLAAEHHGIPYASVLVLIAGSMLRPELVGDALNEVRAEQGLPPDPDLTMLRRYLVLSPVPASFRDPAFPLPATGIAFRPDVSTSDEPSWPVTRPDAPTVYVTLGTEFNLESGDLFSRVLSGVRELPVNVVMTVGRHLDPAEFGTQPPHVHIARYLPQEQVLPYCDVVVSHGGSGSVTGTLAHGLPSVVLPMGADQPHNAAQISRLGCGIVLDSFTATPDEIRHAVSTVLADPAYRRAARWMRAELAALPGPAEMVPLLENLGQS